MKIIIIGGLASSLVNFRGHLISSLIKDGHEIVTMAAYTDKVNTNKIESLGCRFNPFPLQRNGLNPLSDVYALFKLFLALKRERPDIVISYTIKPIIFSGLLSHFLPKYRFFALVTGLGFAFQSDNWKKSILFKVATFLYRISLTNVQKVIFQNLDNKKTFLDLGLVRENKTEIINGSGVDLNYFEVLDFPSNLNFLMISRLLGDKGVREFIEASNMVKKDYPEVTFKLVGPEDPSPDGISESEIKNLNKYGGVTFHGETSDVRPFLKGCSIFVLPSYHEGMPRTILEAMASSRPILTTDVPGCRETVINGKNGWLVKKGSAQELAERMMWFINNKNLLLHMGKESRIIAEKQFDVKDVNSKLFSILELSKKYTNNAN